MSDEFKPNIWRLQTKFDTEGLTNALQDDDAGIRKRAAAALRALGVQDAIPALRVALVNEQDPETRASLESALDALVAEHNAPEKPLSTQERAAVSVEDRSAKLLEQLKGGDDNRVIAAAKELAKMGNKEVVDALIMRFNDTHLNTKARLVIAEVLLKLDSAPAEVSLLATLSNPNWHIRRNGAAILGQLRATWAIEPLSKTLLDKNKVVRRTAHAALKHIGTPEAIAAIKRTRRLIEAKRQRQTGETTAVEADEAEAILPESSQASPQPSAEELVRARHPTRPLPPLAPDDGLLSRVDKDNAGDSTPDNDGKTD